MCEPKRVSCDVCRTINLAKHVKQPKPDMQVHEKCVPVQKFECPRVTELPLYPTCIKVCTKEEYNLRKRGIKPLVPRAPYYMHGKLLYAVKAGILIGSVYFTYSQGIWGDQRDVTECLRRWSEYIHSLNTRRPPTFDSNGNVIKKESVESLFAPVYALYKGLLTSCFSEPVNSILCPLLMPDQCGIIYEITSRYRGGHCPYFMECRGVAKIPVVIKCAYLDYLKELEKKHAEEVRERQLRKKA